MTQFTQTKSSKKDDLYVTAGERLYCIGSQDGLFPNFGRHSVNEMGGIWAHPAKLMDGFYLSISTSDNYNWLKKADNITTSPYDTTFNYFLKDLNLEVERKQFVPVSQMSMAITYKIKNNSNENKELNISFLGRTELLPVWPHEALNIQIGEDNCIFDKELGAFIGNNSENPYFVVFGSKNNPDSTLISKEFFGPELNIGHGISALQCHKIILNKGETIELNYYIGGSYKNQEEAINSFRRIIKDYNSFYDEKIRIFNDVLNKSKITTPNKKIDYLCDISKINNQWLIRDVPEIGRGMGAGLPDYPWYFGTDNSYSVPALLTMGEFKLAKDTLKILLDVSIRENGNGQIVHEISTNGVVYNKGNTQETAHFINAVWQVYKWTGDKIFLDDMFDYCKKGINWLTTDMDKDGDLFPEGYGIMEISGLNAELIDTAVYTAEAFKSIALMAEIYGELDYSKIYLELHKKAVENINTRFFVEEEGLYADVIATPKQILEAFPQYRERHNKFTGGEYHNRLAKLDRLKYTLELPENQNDDYQNTEIPWCIFKNWVIATPLEQNYAEKFRALKILDIMSTNEFIGSHGLYIEALGRNIMMTISTALLAVCEGVYGRVDNMLEYMEMLHNTIGLEAPLSISEISPVGGCFVQEWTIYGTCYPVIKYIFGIEPDIYKNEITIKPNLPTGWDKCKLENITIGECCLNILIEKDDKTGIETINIKTNKSVKLLYNESSTRKFIIDLK